MTEIEPRLKREVMLLLVRLLTWQHVEVLSSCFRRGPRDNVEVRGGYCRGDTGNR